MPLRTDLDHIFVTGSAEDQALSRKGSGDPKIRPIEDRAAHGAALVQGLTNAVEELQRDRNAYALITAKAVALPELSWPERVRVFALAVTALDQPLFGEPTTWSAALDALAAGASIDQSADDEGIVVHMADPEGNEFCLAQYYS